MNNMRKNGVVGVLENQSFDVSTNVHFSEWWNGEGLDFEVSHGKETKRFSLHIDEMHLLATAMNACGMIDLDEIEKATDRLVAESKARHEYIETKRQEYSDSYVHGKETW